MFPWYSAQQPILWWSPDPRMVLFPAGVQSLAQSRQDLAQRPLRVPFRHCVRRDDPRLRRAAPLGCGHLAQRGNDRFLRRAAPLGLRPLGGNLARRSSSWGASTGCSSSGVFFGESMFSRERDASKVALARLVEASCRRAVSSSSTARSRARTSPASAPARSRATNSCTCCSAGRGAFPAAAGREIALPGAFMHNAPGSLDSTRKHVKRRGNSVRG